jgi:GntR family transcriptional regulator of vanillate catabolism
VTIIDVRGARGGMQTARALIALREMVLTGELAPGERVLETWLVERLGVSRTPIRAAIARLHDEGFLESPPAPAIPCGPSPKRIGDDICDG